MIFVLLDTNIIIDMVVDRRKCINPAILQDFLNLLDYDEIKLIMPNIVEVETQRHLNDEFERVGKNLDAAKKTIDNLYGISTLKGTRLELEEHKKKARQELAQVWDIYDQNKDEYKKDIEYVIELLINHKNTCRISDSNLYNGVMERRILQKAPMHKVEKESYGDALIIETLVNLKKYQTISTEDSIYFVTGNTADFSDMNNKRELHKDIIEDLKNKGLENVEYVTTFKELISVKLKSSISNVKILKRIEEELKLQEEEYLADIRDIERESFGLPSISSIVSDVEDILTDSDYGENICEISDRLDKIQRELEEKTDEYDYILDRIGELNYGELELFVKAVCDCYPDLVCGCSETRSLLEIIENVKMKKNQLDSINIIGNENNSLNKRTLSDVSYGESINLSSVDNGDYIYAIDNLYLCEEEGSTDKIEISLSGEDDITYGTVNVTYGFACPNEDGDIGELEDSEVCISADDILTKLKDIASAWDDFLSNENAFIEDLNNCLDSLE